MSEYKPTPEEESAQRRADNDREGQAECAAALAAGELARAKSAGPVGSLGVVGGSLPVSSAEVFMALMTMADEYEVKHLERTADLIRRVAEEYRRHAACKNKRQPEENV